MQFAVKSVHKFVMVKNLKTLQAPTAEKYQHARVETQNAALDPITWFYSENMNINLL